ncbi:hypothetical protein BKA70DRAFT_1522040, partial [Coprinopsis sp. MPI-PUGE-AT-0042]
VTFFDVPWPTTGTVVEGQSVIGISPISVDQAGATHYVYSPHWSILPRLGAIDFLCPFFTYPRTGTFKVDATREVHEYTSTFWTGDIVYEDIYECVHYKDDKSVCVKREIGKQAGATITVSDLTVTGTRTPWATVTNVEAALPASHSNGGANRAFAHANLAAVVITSIGLGVALVLM